MWSPLSFFKKHERKRREKEKEKEKKEKKEKQSRKQEDDKEAEEESETAEAEGDEGMIFALFPKNVPECFCFARERRRETQSRAVACSGREEDKAFTVPGPPRVHRWQRLLRRRRPQAAALAVEPEIAKKAPSGLFGDPGGSDAVGSAPNRARSVALFQKTHRSCFKERARARGLGDNNFQKNEFPLRYARRYAREDTSRRHDP